jgi:ParB-like nuclease domain
MKLVSLTPEEFVISADLRRSGSAKQFEERLKASIDEIGLAEPLKVAPLPGGNYLVIDGTLRLRAITAIRDADPNRFKTIPAYVTEYERRFEIRYQTDIYQDLLPSQLATLVEYLHQTEHVKKTDIARYIGVSPATLRNYTGLWRLVQRGGLCARIVDLMDVGVIPSSNPYAWLRLTAEGIKHVLTEWFCEGETVETWVEKRIAAAQQGSTFRFTTYFVESATDDLEARFYREGEDVRSVKRDLGLRRAANVPLPAFPKPTAPKRDTTAALRHLVQVARESPEPVLQSAARSLREYLR